MDQWSPYVKLLSNFFDQPCFFFFTLTITAGLPTWSIVVISIGSVSLIAVIGLIIGHLCHQKRYSFLNISEHSSSELSSFSPFHTPNNPVGIKTSHELSQISVFFIMFIIQLFKLLLQGLRLLYVIDMYNMSH